VVELDLRQLMVVVGWRDGRGKGFRLKFRSKRYTHVTKDASIGVQLELQLMQY
jgi:hypothetical protein